MKIQEILYNELSNDESVKEQMIEITENNHTQKVKKQRVVSKQKEVPNDESDEVDDTPITAQQVLEYLESRGMQKTPVNYDCAKKFLMENRQANKVKKVEWVEEIEEYDEDVKEDIRFSINPSEEEKETIRFRISEPEHSPDIRYRASERSSVADSAFDAEMTKAAKEVKDAIDALLMTGFPVDVIQSWLTEKVKLSRLRITRQFKILLVDYDKEIKMGPLPKTVFLFYLRHPEGVKFSYLQDHINELLHIYGHVSVNDDLKKMRESIASLIDPFNNSICEKCAAIKKAFVLQVKDSVAKNYYVTGMQGGKKGIALDRRLVEWECEL